MALQWTFVASFLYIEIFLVTLLLLPIISATRWKRVFNLFKTGRLNRIMSYSHYYFNAFIVILLVLFADSIREVRKYNVPLSEGVDLDHHPDAEVAAHMKLFRAQRNFYISGFALFLWFIIKRLVTLLSQQAQLTAETEAMRRQAVSSTEAAQRLLNDGQNTANKSKENECNETELKTVRKRFDATKDELERKDDELKHAKTDLESLKKQAQSTDREYDRLLKEHAILQEKYDKSEDTKKDK